MGFTRKTGQLLIAFLLLAGAREQLAAALAVPAFGSSGTRTAGLTTATTIASPSPLVGDFEIMVATTITGGSISITNTGGSAWTLMAGLPIDPGADDKLYVWYRFFQTGDSDPQLTAATDHFVAFRTTYRAGSVDVDTPIDSIVTGTETVSDTSFSFTTSTSSVSDNSKIVCIATSGFDSNTGQIPVMTNASITSITSRANMETSNGDGGGFGYTDGNLATHGDMGTFACTYTNASQKAYVAFAVRPLTNATVDRGNATAASGASTASPANVSGLSAGDLDLLFASTADGQTLSITAAGGGAWTAIAGLPVTVTGGENLYGWWRISQAGDTAPTVTASGDHVAAARSAWQPGTSFATNPIYSVTTGTETTSDTSFSFAPAITQTNAKDAAVCYTTSRQSTALGTQANTSLSNVSQIGTSQTTQGSTGALEGLRGYRGYSADVGTFTLTYTTASPKSYVALFIKSGSAPTQSSTNGFFQW